jgi:phage FluMu gp28-like protein
LRKSQLAQLVLDSADTGVSLYDWQKRWLDDESRFRVMLKSRAVGGSFLIALESFLDSLLYPNHTTLLVSFSMRQSLELFRKVKEHINTWRGIRIRAGDETYTFTATLSETKTQVEFLNGSRITSLPNNPDAIRGYRADHVYVDEAAMFKNDFEVKAAIIPTIAGREGRLSLISTPKGKRGWFYEAWTSDIFTKHEVHYSMAPHITKTDLEGMRASLSPLEWEQEMELKFIDEANALFPYELILSCAEDYEPELRPYGEPVYLGVDFGRYRDSTVVCAVEKGEKLRVVFLMEMLGVDLNNQLATIRKMVEILRPVGIAIDKTGMGIPLFDILSRAYQHIEGVTFTAKMRTALINMLANVFTNKKIVIPTHEKLINQLRQFQKTGAPAGEHDDYVMALALAIHSAVTGPQPGSVRTGWAF